MPKAEYSLCWDCSKATGQDDCEWANRFRPVKGWNAEPTVRKSGTPWEMHSYRVDECPKFQRDGWNGGQMRPGEYEQRRTKKKNVHHNPERQPIPGGNGVVFD